MYELMVALPRKFERLHRALSNYQLPPNHQPVLEEAQTAYDELAELVDAFRDLIRLVRESEASTYDQPDQWESDHAGLVDAVGQIAQHALRAYYALLMEHALMLDTLGECRSDGDLHTTPFCPGHPDFEHLAAILRNLFTNRLFDLEHLELEKLIRQCTDQLGRLDCERLMRELAGCICDCGCSDQGPPGE